MVPMTRLAGAVNYCLRPVYERDQTPLDHAIGAFCLAVIGLSLLVLAYGFSLDQPRDVPHCTPAVCTMPIEWKAGLQ